MLVITLLNGLLRKVIRNIGPFSKKVCILDVGENLRCSGAPYVAPHTYLAVGLSARGWGVLSPHYYVNILF